MSESNDHSNIVLRRMLDANVNRVMEGLRTLEDVARFSDLGPLQSQYKSIRHELQRSIDTLGISALVSARDAQGDVGKDAKTASEMERPQGIESIVAAAGARVQQGLRVIEESSKVLMASESGSLESLRYRVYDLNSALQLACQRDLGFLRQSRLYVLVDCRLELDEFVCRVQELSRAGVQLIQIRDKQAQPNRIVKYVQASVECLDPSATRVVVNDRVDIAATTRAHGVHVGQEDLGPAASRRLLQPWQFLGLSTHDIDQVQYALDIGVDYIGCGPTFPSQTKSFESYSGTDFLKTAADWFQSVSSDLPAFAIGGIDPGNLDQVIRAGFHRIAVGSCVWNAENPANVAEKLRVMLDRAAR